MGIQAIINRIFAENEEKNNGKLTINLSKDQVYNHVMEKLKLIEIISEKANANKSTKSYSNFETLEKYARNYEENAKNIKLIIDKNRKIYTSILGLTSHEK